MPRFVGFPVFDNRDLNKNMGYLSRLIPPRSAPSFSQLSDDHTLIGAVVNDLPKGKNSYWRANQDRCFIQGLGYYRSDLLGPQNEQFEHLV